jgi:multiple antibiotic resistance protein
MQQVILHGATVFMGFFAIMNPIANTPVFIGLTAGDDAHMRALIARKSVLLAFLIVVVFCLTGKLVFALFGLTLPALHIAGGFIVFMIGLHMLQGEPSKVHNPSVEDNQASLEAELSVAVSPLAIPILAGPGTIATAMNYSATGGYLEIAVTIAAFALLCLITYGFFIYGQRFVGYIGDGAVKVITRLMGLILAVIGTQMFINGVYGAARAYS